MGGTLPTYPWADMSFSDIDSETAIVRSGEIDLIYSAGEDTQSTGPKSATAHGDTQLIMVPPPLIASQMWKKPKTTSSLKRKLNLPMVLNPQM